MKKFSIFNFQFSNSRFARSGQLSLQVLIVGAIGTFLIMGFVSWTDTYVRSVSRSTNNSQAFTIAEAGIEYYRWHLAHAPQDFKDGNATSLKQVEISPIQIVRFYYHFYRNKDECMVQLKSHYHL